MKRSRKYLEKQNQLGNNGALMDVATALELIKKIAKDWESVDLDVRLGINPRKADQNIRGTTILPAGTGKTPTVTVLCSEDKIEEAKEAGADHAGLDDLIEKIRDGWLDFDMVIATPDVMKNVSKVAKILGPRGMMPNPKSGTVTPNVADAVKEAKAGKVEYRADKTGIVHLSIGRAGFSAEDLISNALHILNTLIKSRPASVKGQYVKSVYLSTTQSPSVRIDVSGMTR
jgi:large subunit ribosomal protein L1